MKTVVIYLEEYWNKNKSATNALFDIGNLSRGVWGIFCKTTLTWRLIWTYLNEWGEHDACTMRLRRYSYLYFYKWLVCLLIELMDILLHIMSMDESSVSLLMVKSRNWAKEYSESWGTHSKQQGLLKSVITTFNNGRIIKKLYLYGSIRSRHITRVTAFCRIRHPWTCWLV